MKKAYVNEREGQIDFFDNFNIPYEDNDSILIDNTDGVYNGNILEFKLNISNLGKVLFQAIKYLSKMRIKGRSVPARILLVDLNETKVYEYHSIDYIDEIQKMYVGGASKNNDFFNNDIKPNQTYDYSKMIDSDKVKKLLINKVSNWYIPIDIDEDCIVGWAERYYREIPSATKGDFLGDGTGKINIYGEIRDPKRFKGLINPYTKPTNEKFKYLMDCLNDRLSKKDLGAFYTPEPYCEKASELVIKAVERVPEGNDYIILDRCAGTGNLEVALIGKFDINGDELISHCVVSTYEYYEYKVLQERLGDKVRNIIPPTEANVIYENGKVSNADAMSKDFIENPLIKQYVDDDKCTIILFENPPYRDDISDNSMKRKDVTVRVPYVQQEFKKILTTLSNSNISTARDLANQFIWSGFKYYLHQKTDSYVLFSPIKYWKSLGLVCKRFNSGYLFNRAHFHASTSAIACILWENKEDYNEKIVVDAYDIMNNETVFIKPITLHKCHNSLLPFFDKRKDSKDISTEVYCERNGEQTSGRKCDGTSYYNNNIIAYLQAQGYSIDAKHVCLTRATTYNIRGFYLRKDAYLKACPLFVAKLYGQDEWYERDVFFNTSDGGDAYTYDADFLKSCLIYTCLSNQNKCLSFNGSDGRYYRNELCFDTTNGETVASSDLAKMSLDNDEKNLIKLWNNILNEAKKTKNYDPKLTYGVYQITKELNTTHEEIIGKEKKKVPDYVELNSHLENLRKNLKEYYKSHITEKMFKFELLK